MANGEPKKKKKGKGCLIAFLVVGAVALIAGGGSSDNESAETEEPTREIETNADLSETKTELSVIETAETEKETQKPDTAPATQSEEEIRADYIAGCTAADYRAIARNPGEYEGKDVMFTGDVIQVVEGWFGSVTLRVQTDDGIWYCTYSRSEDESRILEDDMITVYGMCTGVESYTTIFGATETIPSVAINYYDLIDDGSGTYAPSSAQSASTTASASDPYAGLTAGQINALKKADSYLDFMAFSWQGLIDQLVYEKFSQEDATYAANHCGADWNAQALKKAKSYLDFSSFSYTGLIKQLEYEKFSHELAVYAADNCGADWNEQAAKKAKSYLDFSAFSRDGLIGQLEYEGFTYEQAVYGVEQNGY